jgi:hypothetical protein
MTKIDLGDEASHTLSAGAPSVTIRLGDQVVHIEPMNEPALPGSPPFSEPTALVIEGMLEAALAVVRRGRA